MADITMLNAADTAEMMAMVSQAAVVPPALDPAFHKAYRKLASLEVAKRVECMSRQERERGLLARKERTRRVDLPSCALATGYSISCITYEASGESSTALMCSPESSMSQAPHKQASVGPMASQRGAGSGDAGNLHASEESWIEKEIGKRFSMVPRQGSRVPVPKNIPLITDITFRRVIRDEACRRALVEDAREHAHRQIQRQAAKQRGDVLARMGAASLPEELQLRGLSPHGTTVGAVGVDNMISPTAQNARGAGPGPPPLAGEYGVDPTAYIARMRRNYFVDRVNKDMRKALVEDAPMYEPPAGIVKQLQAAKTVDEVGALGLYDPKQPHDGKPVRGRMSRRQTLRQHPEATVALFDEESTNREDLEDDEFEIWDAMMAAAATLRGVAERLYACRTGQDTRRTWLVDSALLQLVELKEYERRRRRLLFQKNEKAVREHLQVAHCLGLTEEREWFSRGVLEYDRRVDGWALRGACEASHRRVLENAHIRDRDATVAAKEQHDWMTMMLKHKIALGRDRKQKRYDELARRMRGVEPYETSIRAGVARDEQLDWEELMLDWVDAVDDVIELLIDQEVSARALQDAHYLETLPSLEVAWCAGVAEADRRLAARIAEIQDDLDAVATDAAAAREALEKEEATARLVNLTSSDAYDYICTQIPKQLLARVYEPLYAEVVAHEAARRPQIVAEATAAHAVFTPLFGVCGDHEAQRLAMVAEEDAGRGYLVGTEAATRAVAAARSGRLDVYDEECGVRQELHNGFAHRLARLTALRHWEARERVWMSGLDVNVRETRVEAQHRLDACSAREAARSRARCELAPIYVMRDERAGRAAVAADETFERKRIDAFAVYFPWLRMCCTRYPDRTGVAHPYLSLLQLFNASVGKETREGGGPARPGREALAASTKPAARLTGLARVYNAVHERRRMLGEDVHAGAAPQRSGPFAHERHVLEGYHRFCTAAPPAANKAALRAHRVCVARAADNVAPAAFRARAGCSIYAFHPVPWERYDVAFMAKFAAPVGRALDFANQTNASGVSVVTAPWELAGEIVPSQQQQQHVVLATPSRAERWCAFSPNTTGSRSRGSEWGLSTLNTTSSASAAATASSRFNGTGTSASRGGWGPVGFEGSLPPASAPPRFDSASPAHSAGAGNGVGGYFDESGDYHDTPVLAPLDAPPPPALLPQYLGDVVYGQRLGALHVLSSLVDANRTRLALPNHVTMLVDAHLRDQELAYASAVVLAVAACAAALRTSVLRPRVFNVLLPVLRGFHARKALATRAFAPNIGLGLLLATAKRTLDPTSYAVPQPVAAWNAYTAVYQPHARPAQQDLAASLSRCLASGRRQQGIELYIQAKLRADGGLSKGLYPSALLCHGSTAASLVRTKAACVIQTCFRAFRKRLVALEKRHALLVAQEEERERAAEQEVIWVAALNIQRVWRGWKGWCRCIKLQYDAVVAGFRDDPENRGHFAREIQKVFRAFLAGNRIVRLVQEREAAAYRQLHSPYARTIQRFYRGFTARKRVQAMEYAQLEREFADAWADTTALATVQRVCRGFKGRNDALKKQYARVREEGEAQCATQIQKVFRGHLERNSIHQRRRDRWDAAGVLQRTGRGGLARKDVAQKHGVAQLKAQTLAVTEIQRMVRGQQARNKALRRKYLLLHKDGEDECARHIQRVFRGFKTREPMEKQEYEAMVAEYETTMAEHVIPIQRAYRGYKGRQVALQKAYAKVEAEYEAYDKVYKMHAAAAAMIIQRVYRGVLGRRRAQRREYQRIEEAYADEVDPYARTVQRHYRGELGRREAVARNYRLLEQAYNLSAEPHARTIQRIWRGHRGRVAARAQRDFLVNRMKSMRAERRRSSFAPRRVRKLAYIDRGVAL